MESITSVGLLNYNSIQLGGDVLVYTDIKVYEDFSQSLYLMLANTGRLSINTILMKC